MDDLFFQLVIYQYRAKRASLDLRNIEKQIVKAKKALSGQIPDQQNEIFECDFQQQTAQPKAN